METACIETAASPTVWLRLPMDVSSISIGGQSFVPDGDRFVEVPERSLALMFYFR